MELVFIARAVRRYWWLTAGVVIAATAGALLLASGRGSSYESESLVLVTPAEESAFGGTASDRYVQNQLVVFESGVLAQRVAESLGGLSVEEIRGSVTFEQLTGTDVVAVRVQSSSPEQARDIADAYAVAYVEVVRDQEADARRPRLEVLEREVEEAAELLADLNSSVETVMEQYLASLGDGSGQVVPDLDQVAPGLATERDAVRERYFELLAARNALVDDLSRLESGVGQFVQGASVPVDQTTGPILLVVAGLFVGGLLGTLAAFAVARLSPRVLDADEVVERLAMPVATSLPPDPAMIRRAALLDTPLAPGTAQVISELCVRAEARGPRGSSLKVVVVGTDAGAGVTSIAVLMARRFAADGDVLLVDASTSSPEISRVIVPGSDGVRRFVRAIRRRRRDDGGTSPRRAAATETHVPGLRVAGLGDTEETIRIQRGEVVPLVETLDGAADVVVIDAGGLLSAASSVQLAELADVVVLAVPLRHQRSDTLTVAASQLDHVAGIVLPVLTAARRSKRRSPRPMPSVRRPAPREEEPPVPDAPAEVEVRSEPAAGSHRG